MFLVGQDETAAAYFLHMLSYLFSSIFPCFIVEIKFIGLALEEEGDKNRKIKDRAVNCMLLIKTRNKEKGKAGASRKKIIYYIIDH